MTYYINVYPDGNFGWPYEKPDDARTARMVTCLYMLVVRMK